MESWLKVGRAQVKPDATAHRAGVREGNEGPYEKMPGHRPDGTSTAERSTGVNAHMANPVDPRMPNLSPP